jgi:hypothetical protein
MVVELVTENNGVETLFLTRHDGEEEEEREEEGKGEEGSEYKLLPEQGGEVKDHGCCNDVVHCCDTVLTLFSHCSHTVVTLLLHCSYTVVRTPHGRGQHSSMPAPDGLLS